MLTQCLILLLILSTSANASFSNLLKEFKSQNKMLKNAADKKFMVDLDYDILEASRETALSFGYSNVDNQQDAAGAFNTNQVEATEFNLGIAKSFDFGTTISFESTKRLLDRSAWNPIILGNTPIELNEFSQELTLTQSLGADFFGRQFRQDLKIARLKQDTAATELDRDKQELVQLFFKNYMEMKKAKSLVLLQKQALQRAAKRKRNLQKRVRDGVSNKVDLYQANLSVISQQENLKRANQVLASAIEAISRDLHREVKNNEIKAFSFAKKYKFKTTSGMVDENLDLKILNQQFQVASEVLEKSKNAVFPEITLTGAVKTNDFDPSSSETRSRGNIFEDQRELTIAVNVSMPLSLKSQRTARAKDTLQKLIAHRDLQASKENVKILESQLVKSEKLNFENVELAQSRQKWAQKTLKEQNRLYNLGRADFDQLIRSEEDLINSQVSLVNYLSAFYQIQVLKYKLYGKTMNFVNEFED